MAMVSATLRLRIGMAMAGAITGIAMIATQTSTQVVLAAVVAVVLHVAMLRPDITALTI